ncbi:MAG: hypothetical protein N2491_07110 [Negativicutes bacterium]|nr:hypothetical protein [Negativicutes bacterium]
MLGMSKADILQEATKLTQQNMPFPNAIAEIMEKNNKLLTDQIRQMIDAAKGQPPFDLM